MMEEHATDANHIVETVHRFLNTRRSQKQLPKRLVVQLDTCSREHKHKHLMYYHENLVAVLAFDIVEVGFCPVRHCHENKDHYFSQNSGLLHYNDTITLQVLYFELRYTSKGTTNACCLKRIAKFSGLWILERCLNQVDTIPEHRYFKFSRVFSDCDTVADGRFKTVCHVKKNVVIHGSRYLQDTPSNKQQVCSNSVRIWRKLGV